MRPVTTTILVTLVLSSHLGPGGGSAARGQEIPPARILKNHGLERKRGSASSWIHAEEATVLRKFRTAKALTQKLGAAREAQQQLEMAGQNPQALIAFYQAQIDLGDARTSEIDRQLASLGPSVGNVTVDNWHNLLVQERNAIIGEQRRLQTVINDIARQGGAFREQKRQFHGEMAGLQDSYRQAIDELRNAVDKMHKKYAELGTDSEITKALADLSAATHFKQKLGPSRDFQVVVRWLEGDRASGSRRDRHAGPRRR
jgi:hypothetical protein